jgi:type I restriction enzyme S subunit
MYDTATYPTVRLEGLVDVLDHLRAPVNGEERSRRAGTIPYYGANGQQGWIDKPLTNEPLILLAEDGGNFDAFAERPIAYRIEGPAWVNNHAHIIRAKPGVSQSFVYWSIAHKDIRQFIAGGTRTKLTQGELRRIEVRAPGESDRVQIARVLDTLDTTIRQTEAIIDKLKQVKQGLLHDLLSRGIDANGELRPPQSEAPHLYKDSPLGQIPREWNADSFSRLAEFINGNSFDAARWSERGLPIIRIQNLNGSREFNFYHGPINPKWHVLPGDLLFAWSGQRGVSFGARIWRGPEGVLNQHIFKVIERRALVTKRFLFEVLRFRQSVIEDSAHGFKDSFLHVTRGELGCVMAGIPAASEQDAIVARIEVFERRLTNERSTLEKLKAMKSGLMGDLLTGRVRVTPLLESARAVD